MQLNAIFPTRDIGNDPAKIRDWAQAAEALGYAYIEVPDHVFGAAARGSWTPTYNEKDPFHETFVMLGFLAAVTKTIRLSSGVLISPQRQTGLIAKQAAEADLLSGGRLRQSRSRYCAGCGAKPWSPTTAALIVWRRSASCRHRRSDRYQFGWAVYRRAR
jgi:Luciferase-like monooxygenase